MPASPIQKAIKEVLDFLKANEHCTASKRRKTIRSIIRSHGITAKVFNRAVNEMLGRLEARLAECEAEMAQAVAECEAKAAQLAAERAQLRAEYQAEMAQLTAEIEQILDRWIAEEGCAQNDVEGAALAVAALRATHPSRTQENRIMREYCALLGIVDEYPDCDELQQRGDELLAIIDDGAERLLAQLRTPHGEL